MDGHVCPLRLDCNSKVEIFSFEHNSFRTISEEVGMGEVGGQPSKPGSHVEDSAHRDKPAENNWNCKNNQKSKLILYISFLRSPKHPSHILLSSPGKGGATSRAIP